MIKKKVYIPNREYPDVNFLGLLIGPRGRTQKELESRTGARILIRGKGSQKGGEYSGPSGNPDDDDEQHVSIEGTEEAVSKALAEVRSIQQMAYSFFLCVFSLKRIILSVLWRALECRM